MDQRLQRYTFFYLSQNVFSNNFLKKQLGVIVTLVSLTKCQTHKLEIFICGHSTM